MQRHQICDTDSARKILYIQKKENETSNCNHTICILQNKLATKK